MTESTTTAARYECSQCEASFTPDEYENAERQLTNPDAENPERYGYEKVCPECGHGFHTEKWSALDDVDTDDGEFTIVTCGLVHGHGMNYDLFYETYILHPWGDHIAGRSRTKDEAKADHEQYVEQIREGRYDREPAGWRLVLEENDG